MIYLKLCQAGELVNHKRVERLYALGSHAHAQADVEGTRLPS
jgi:hypothetical protein